MLRQPDGKIILAGFALTEQSLCCCRYSPEGSLDSTVGTGGKVLTSLSSTLVVTGKAVAVQADETLSGNLG
jgi:hypothetical protein